MNKKIEDFEVKASLSNLFKRLCFKYNYPMHTLPILLKKEILFSGLSEDLVSEVFQSYNKKYFFRFDLTNAFVYSNLKKRGEIGEVFRYGEQSLYRKRAFVQFDIDEVYTDTSILTLLSLVTQFFRICKIGIVIKYNDISKVKQLIHKHTLPLQQTLTLLDKLKKLNEIEVNSELLKLKIQQSLFARFMQDLEKLQCNFKLNDLPAVYDYTIIRGLHIYSDFVFEIYNSKFNLALSSGGKYSHANIDYFGVSIGLTRLISLYNFTELYTTLVVYFTTCNKTKHLLDLIEMHFTFVYLINKADITQSFNYYLKDLLLKNKQFRNLIFIGSKELDSNIIYIKDLANNEIKKLEF